MLHSATGSLDVHYADTGKLCRDRRIYRWLLIAILLVGSFAPLSAQDTAAGAGSDPPGEAAIRGISDGNFSSAAQHLRQAMAVTPDDGLLNDAAGVTAICTGDADTARSAFEHALKADKNDSLALYGIGLARLYKGDRAGALSSFDQSEAVGGDRSFLLIARRYTQWLAGAKVSVAGAGVPELLAPANTALQAAEAYREGNLPAAASGLQNALAALPGDAILEPAGVMMNFDPS